MYYGLLNPQHAKHIAQAVVDALGGGHPAYCLLVETCSAETLLGNYPDRHPDKWGVGACQHDMINLEDIQLNGEQRHFDIVKQRFGYDIRKIDLPDLANDPLLSFICCRLSYKRIPDPIPADLLGRAHYWKDHYNRSGDGEVSDYLERVAECLGEEWQ